MIQAVAINTRKRVKGKWPKKAPTWDLKDLYPSMTSPRIAEDIEWCKAQAARFRKQYEGKIAGLTGVKLAAAIGQFESLSDRLGRLGSFAQLLYAADSTAAGVGRFYQNIREQGVAIGNDTLFFTLELNALSDGQLKEKLQDAALKKYTPWLRDVRVYKTHVLSADLEKLMHEKDLTSNAAWVRLFDETLEAMRFKVSGKELAIAEAMDLLSSPKPKKREAAAKALHKGLSAQIRTFTHITNTLAKDKEIEDTWRKYAKPISSRNVGNFVEDEVVEALLGSVKANYKNLSHRYYKYKAKLLKKKKLEFWDRNAPLPGDANRVYRWDEAVEIVLDAYHRFSPTFAEMGAEFFKNPWIDGAMRKGKTSGAFAHPTVPSAHPYLLVNYQGKLDDVATLAHELGHGVHQLLSANKGALMADTPLTLAETASVFGEQLVFQSLLANEKKAANRRRLIAGKVEDMLNTVVRQTAFCEFERRVHDARREGELMADQIGDIWMAVQQESLGPAFNYRKEYRHYWAYIPHFIHTPFYVYAYAFGDCLVNSLYGVYQKGRGASGRNPDFEKKYLAMLEAGGTLHHKELLKPFGLNAAKPSFWQEGLDVISGYIDELEASE